MDPHQLQNNLGMNGMQNYQFLMQQQQQQPQQQQQQPPIPAANPAQFSSFQQLYQAPPLNMFPDPTALFMPQNTHPNQNLLFQMQQSQPQLYPQQQLYQQQMLQQQQPQYIMQHALQQVQQHNQQHQQLQQQQQQHQQQQQQQQLQRVAQEQAEEQLRQRQLAEQQNRQMELLRKEQEATRRKQEVEEARKREQLREQMRIEEEKRKRMAEEEERRRIEAERRRIEEEKRQDELRRIEAEEATRKRIAEEANNEILRKSEMIPKPFTLVACAPLTKLTGILPFPSEAPLYSASSAVCQPDSLNTCLNNFDPETISIIAEALGGVDISHVMVRGEEIKEEIIERHSEHPPLIAKLLEINSSCLSVDDEISTLLSAFDGTDMDTSGASDGGAGPSTSTHPPVAPPANSEAMRRMISLGKQPKGKEGNKGGGRKKDMVEDLFDSLTDYFDPSDRRRKRQKVKTYEEEQLETRELEMVAASEMKNAEKAKEREKENELMVDDIDQLEGKFFEKKRQKKKEREAERPPTPTEVLRQREEEWRERERKRHEKRRKRMDDSEDLWSNDVRAEKESLTRCSNLIDTVLDSVDVDANDIDEDSEMPQELLIERGLLAQLREEVQKLKMFKKMHEVPTDRVTRLLTILERNMRDVIASEGRSAIVPITDEECGEEENELFREMIDDRLQRGADAACTALSTITANKMPKTVFVEDTMERAVQVCKQYLSTIIFPASDILYQGANKSKRIVEETPRKKRKMGGANRTPIVQILYTRMLDLMGCFGELVRHHSLQDTLYHQLNTAALSCFFVNNIAELQLKAMTVLANIFSRVDDHIRSPLISDLLNSLHRLPSKSNVNCYALSTGQTISYSTCLFMLLIQSSIKIPHRRRRREEEEEDEEVIRDFSKEDQILRESIAEAKTLCNKFIMGFLTKVTSKGEDEYRNLFSLFLHDLLSAFMVPEWPVAEMILNAVGIYICSLYRNKVDISVRCLIMEYLGAMCARLSKEKKERGGDSEERLAVVVKTLLYCERDDERTSMEEIDVSDMSSNELLRKAEKGFIDFLVVTNSSSEFSVEYAIKYYVGDWYRMTIDDIDAYKERLKIEKRNGEESDRDRRKADRKLEKVEEKGRKQKEFLLELSDKKMIKKRADQVARAGSVMLTADATWLIKHLAMNRDFCNSFDNYLKQILVGVTSEGAVGLRTRAMKSLTQIIEVDYNILCLPDVRRSVHARMTDPNAQVREATIELLGKFIVARPDLIQDYYNIIIERIKDSGTSVRKRIIRIMREYCEKNPEYENNCEMLSRIVRRVNDEEGVKKLVLETLGALWLQPVKYKETLTNKVAVLTQVITILMRESGGIDSLEAVFAALLKADGEKAAIAATHQIVDTLFDEVIQLDTCVDSDDSLSNAEKAKKRQDKMLACLAGLSIFSKVRPVLLLKHIEALQPYLSMSAKTTVEQSVLNQVILMLERVIPLIDHPSAEFISRVDKNLGELVKQSGMIITASAISCAAALHKKAPKLRPSITGTFLQYLKGILTWKKKLGIAGVEIGQQVMPIIQRSVFALGLMTRYYEWDSILSDEEVGALPLVTTVSLAEKSEEDGEKEEGKRAIRDNVFILLLFFSSHDDPNLKTKALTALGHVSAEYPEYLQKSEVLILYNHAMKNVDRHSLQMKIQALKNLEMFLLNEEKKAIKTTQEWERIKDEQELKEMELAGSGLGSAVIQRYWQLVLDSYFNSLLEVRQAAMQVVWQTLSQGLVTPGNSIHVLIAMSTDPISAIRHKVESLVKDIDNKYQGMIQSKAVHGVRSSFRLQRLVKEDPNSIVRGIRAVEQSAMSSGKSISMQYGAPKYSNDGQALLSGLYQSLRGNKQQRRSLVNSMLRLFTEDSSQRLSIDEWIFIADNLALFPYHVMDEPLYVCKSVESVLTIHGHSMLTQFVAELAPLKDTDPTDDDYVFVAESLLVRFPANTDKLYQIMDHSQAYFTLLYLKNFLMKLYSITDARIQEYSTSDTSKGHDKGLGRKNIHMFQPLSSMQQLNPEVRARRGTPQGNYELAAHIAQFRRLLLSIDNKDDEEEEEEEEKGENANQEYNDEEMNMDE